MMEYYEGRELPGRYGTVRPTVPRCAGRAHLSPSPYAEAVDATIACTYAMLAAESLGLGTTMIGGAPPILARNKALSRSLGIPDDHTPAVSLIVGHPATHFRRAIRRRFVS